MENTAESSWSHSLCNRDSGTIMTMPVRRRCPNCNSVFSSDENYCDKDHTRLVVEEMDDPHAPADPLLGKIIDSRYRIKRKLGQGGMGAVYEAVHLILDRRVALKVILKEMDTTDGKSGERFLREGQALGRLSAHPNIVGVHDFGREPSTSETPPETRGLFYLVMEFLVGETVAERLSAGPLSVVQSISIASQTAEALLYAHEHNIVHRDIKPANIFLAQQDEQWDFVKVVDFGLARILDQKAITTDPNAIAGTMDYLAPEAWDRPDKPQPQMDLYALGISIYEMLIGTPPFCTRQSVPPEKIAAHFFKMMGAHLSDIPPRVSSRRPTGAAVPPELDDLVAELLAKDPKARPTASQVVDRLRRLRKTLPPVSHGSALLATMPQIPMGKAGLHEAATQLLPTARADPHEVPTRLIQQGPGAEPDTATAPLVLTHLRQLQHAGVELDVLEEQLERASDQVASLMSSWLDGSRGSWPQSAKEEVDQMQSWISHLTDELLTHRQKLDEVEKERQRERLRLIEQRAQLQLQVVDVVAQRANLPPGAAARSPLENRQTALELQRDAIKSDPSLAGRRFQIEQHMHGLTYALHHARWKLADLVLRTHPVRGGLLGRLRRANSLLRPLRDAASRLDGLLVCQRNLWETFPVLRPQETIRGPHRT